MIEDALDMSRIENNKFTIYKDSFDIRDAVNEVCDIMKFQLDSKGLKLEAKIGDEVPRQITSD